MKFFATTALAGGLFAFGGAASAQDLCGGFGANGTWLGGSEEASDIATSGDYLEQMALVLMNNQYTGLFSVSAPTAVRLEAEGRGGGDPVIDLRDAAGEILLSDDDSGGGGASYAATTLEPGTYCLSMQSYDGSPMTGFVRVSRDGQDQLTDGGGAMPVDAGTDTAADTGTETATDTGTDTGTPSTGGCTMASNALGDGPIDGSLSMGGVSATAPVNQIDAWTFTLSQPAPITITATNEFADPVVTLYDGAGNYLAENDDYDGLNSQLDMTTPLAAGEYCIELAALSDSNEPITVSVTEYDPRAAMDALIAAGEASPPLDGSYPITELGVAQSRLRHDAQVGSDASWFRIDVDEGGLLLIEAVANGNGDPVIFLYDDIGREVAYNDDSGSSYDSMIATRVLPGTYLLGVKQYDESQTSLIRLVVERYVPAN
ncbi:ABC transporter substrate-binding protein [Wenxinia saemankumensis]|uniref:Peptidase C-terminal archaeal/bacterial domain-containing protein n=1 Tax=Wenxinia saemankumensis TaxID=1447782 RepID=A0A1M6E622_9RHOB|nr:ABC transporter substrate-binding protein [Wenxinia saemankumensis]SHI80819.1 hypothetical protein SAMN05444417_1820 [Wenxinia saemankumensis]